jgi:hypothetical protein
MNLTLSPGSTAFEAAFRSLTIGCWSSEPNSWVTGASDFGGCDCGGYVRVGAAGAEQNEDPVVVELAESAPDRPGETAGGFARTLGHACGVSGNDVVSPAAQRPSDGADLRRVASALQMSSSCGSGRASIRTKTTLAMRTPTT